MFDHLDRIEKQLAEAGIKHWEILCSRSLSTPVSYEYDKLKGMGYRETSGIGLRVIHEGRIGLASTSNPNRMTQLTEAALASAVYGEKATFEFPAQPTDGSVKIYDESVPALSGERLVQRGDGIIAAIKEKVPDVQVSVEFHPTVQQVNLRNSAGLNGNYETTGLAVSIEGILIEGDSILSVYDSHDSCRDDAPLEAMANRVVDRVSGARTLSDLSSGAYPVLFSPKAVASLLIAVQMGANGKLVQKGASPLTERIGERIVDSRISIHDDPLLEFQPASRPFDDEGVICRRNTVIEHGVLKGFLFDLQTAGRLGTVSTGSAGRGISDPPSPTWSNLVMEPGQNSVEDLIAGIKKGLFIDQVLGAGQSNLLMGEFSLNVNLGFLVENGEILGRVKNLMVAGNVYEALSNVEAFSREQEYRHGMLLPSILFGKLQVASRT
ncbi:MAG TPA: TldD/PmbA family protein [bacterium]|nr:TldD/PmbA family protein [bacterium]HQQ00223.1 TldD/PmbA family protein [bacterium]